MKHDKTLQKFHKDQVFELTVRNSLVVAGKPEGGIWEVGMYLLDEDGEKVAQLTSIEDIRNAAGSPMALTFAYSSQSDLEKLKKLTASHTLYFVSG